MEIYVGNLPKGTRPAELRKLLKDSVQRNIFQKLFNRILSLGRLDQGVHVKIVKAKNHDGDRYRYGRIKIKSQPLGYVALDSLMRAEIRGAPLAVREFVQRDRRKDRRAPAKQAQTWENERRQLGERRQH